MIRSLQAAALLALALPAAASTIVPANPVAQQAVEARLTVDSCAFNPKTVQVTMNGNTIRITQRPNNCLAPGNVVLADLRLGSFPAGDYRVEVYATPTATGNPVQTLSFTVAPRADTSTGTSTFQPLTNYSGFWWNPDEPGWGMALAQDPVADAIFGAVFRYNADNTPYWYTLQAGHWVTPTQWSGSYVQTLGPIGHATVINTGAATIDFGSLPAGGRATLTIITPGFSQAQYSLVRFAP